jgi:hypothetical protein
LQLHLIFVNFFIVAILHGNLVLRVMFIGVLLAGLVLALDQDAVKNRNRKCQSLA